MPFRGSVRARRRKNQRFSKYFIQCSILPDFRTRVQALLLPLRHHSLRRFDGCRHDHAFLDGGSGTGAAERGARVHCGQLRTQRFSQGAKTTAGGKCKPSLRRRRGLRAGREGGWMPRGMSVFERVPPRPLKSVDFQDWRTFFG